MADPAVVNGLKALTKATEDQTRVMKDMANSFSKCAKALEALNANYVEVNRKDPNVDQ